MKLTESEGKELFRAYGIETPEFELIQPAGGQAGLSYPFMLKSQVLAGDRKAKGGIAVIRNQEEFDAERDNLFDRAIDGFLPEYLLAEAFIAAEQEIYVSFSYASDSRGPMLSLNSKGGSGIESATLVPIDVLAGFDREDAEHALSSAQIAPAPSVVSTVCNLWNLFQSEKLFLAEINPLFVLADGRAVAGDAKVGRDDALLPSTEKVIVPLGGDIAVIASGGGASMLNIDILMRAGGKPANYVEYSGNPPASVVEELTMRVLAQPGLTGAWVVGGTANFTDIYETLSGFAAGLLRVSPKPAYPIVVRRDGPRQKEAKEMLEAFAKEHGFNLSVFGPELSMAESADFLLEQMKQP